MIKLFAEEMTRAEMAAFIRKVASDSFNQDDWSRVMVRHYPDIPTENARARAVEIYHDHSDVPEGEKARLLSILADTLEQATDDSEFYYNGGTVGILGEDLPVEGECEIRYEPCRSGSHFAMHTALGEGENPACETMRGDERIAFTVLASPSYGRLRLRVNT